MTADSEHEKDKNMITKAQYLSGPCKAGQKHRVHAEAEFFLILNDPVTVPLQIIDAFVF